MCLSVNTDLHGIGKSFAPKVAKVPLLVWKSLEKSDTKGAYSPYQWHRWLFGNTETAKLDVERDGPRAINIEGGLHAHILSTEQRKKPSLVKRYVAPAVVCGVFAASCIPL